MRVTRGRRAIFTKRAFERPPRPWTVTGTSLAVAAVAMAGTVTASEVSEALVTAATASPKRTVLPDAEESNPVPVMVTVVPVSALGGVTKERTGGGVCRWE